MTDRFEGHAAALHSPASDGFAVTPSDITPLPETTRALYIGSAGSVSVVMQSGATLLFSGLPSGALLPLRVAQVRATGTTAGAIVGLL